MIGSKFNTIRFGQHKRHMKGILTMSEDSVQSLNLLYWYAPEDQQWRDEIDFHLSDLKRHYHITNVVDGVLLQSIQQDERFLAQLRNTHLVLVLVSAHFEATHFVPRPDIRKNLEWLRWSGNCLVIALLLENVDWDGAPFGSRDVLPSDARPVTKWSSREQAFQDIEKGMRRAIEKRWLIRGDWLLQETHDCEEALKAYDEALRLDPSSKWAWYGKGNALTGLDTPRYEEALDAYDVALQLDPAFSWAWYGKGGAFAGLQRYEEALKAYDEELQLDPSHMHTWYWKGESLKALGRRREVRQAKRKARQLGWPF
jgi:tetratricopeptide (TPR) repeat protein